MSTFDIIVTSFLWGLVAGIIFYRGMATGRWSVKP